MSDDQLREEHRQYLIAPWTWRAYIRRATHYTDTKGRTVEFPKWAKYVLFVLADKADADGTSVRPGVPLLAAEAETSYDRAQDALAIARQAGLLFLAKAGNRRAGRADEYWLIAHPELLDRCRIETPDQVKLRAERMRQERQKRVEKSTATVAAKKAAAAALDGPLAGQDEAIRRATGLSKAESIDGPVAGQNPLSDGPVARQDGVFDGRPASPTTPTRGDHTPKITTPSDGSHLRGPVTLRAHEAAQKTDSIPDSMPAEGGSHPYDRSALAARLAAAKAKHTARANARPGRPPATDDRETNALARLAAAVASLTPPATPA